jgi:hypothetical protein
VGVLWELADTVSVFAVSHLNSKYKEWARFRGREPDMKARELIENRPGPHQDALPFMHFTFTADHTEEREDQEEQAHVT